MKKLYTSFLFILGFLPSLFFAQVPGASCANPIPMYPGTTCNNICGSQLCGYFTSESGSVANVAMTGTTSLDPACTTDNETTQKVEWIEITATCGSFSITNGTNYTGGGAATVEQKDYVVFSGTCGSLTQIACFPSVLNGGVVTVTGLVAGQVYLIMVSQSAASYAACSTCTAVATCVTSSVAAVPPNNACANAYNLTTNVPYETTNANATADGPSVCQSPAAGSVENNVWFSWCAPVGWTVGQKAFLQVYSQICNGTQGLQLSIFGPNPSCTMVAAGTATSVLCQNPGVTTNYSYTFTPVAGNCYLINIDGYAGNACTFFIEVSTTSVICAPPTITVNSPTICPSGSTSLVASGATTYTWSPATGLSSTSGATVTANPTVTTVYTVIGTLGGCSGTKTTTLVVSTSPTVTATASNSVVCLGNSTTLTGGGASTYTWTGGVTNGVAFSPTITSTYTVTGISAAGCANTAVQTVTVNPKPVVTASVTNSVICSGNSTTLNGGGVSTYTWTGGVTNGVAFSPTVTVTYTVTGTSATGCTNTAVQSVTVNPKPTVTASVTNSVICLGNSTTLTGGGASTYTWMSGVTDGVSFSPTVTATYTVTGTSAIGCTNTAVQSITVNPIPTTTASTTGTLTCTTLTVALNSTLAGVSYTWVPPAGGSVASANAQSTTASGATGTYSLFVQSATGCAYSTTTSVTQNTVVPTGVSAGSNQTLTCGSSSVTVSGAVATPTNATVNWTGASVCGVATNYTTSVCGAGTYTLTATDPANGCTATSTVQVFPSAGAPVVTNNPVTNTITCTNTLVTVSISTTATPVTYTWLGTGIVLGNGTGTITVNQGGTFQYTVTNTISGCTTSNNQMVVQNTTVPTTTASTTGTLTCLALNVNLNSTLAGMNYTWTAPAGGSVGSANTQSTIASGVPGTYSLTVVNPVNGCAFSTTTSVSQNTTVPTTMASTTGTVTCTTFTVNLNSTLAGMNYTWTAPSGGLVGSANTQSTTAVGVPGTYSLTVVNPVNGCAFSTTTSVSQNTTVPTTMASTTGTVTCTTFTVNLNSTLAGMNYTWTAPAGSSISSGINTQNAIGMGAGDYSLTVTDPLNGCSYSTTTTATQNTAIPTGVSAGPNQTLTCSSSSVTLTGSVTTPPMYNCIWLGPNVCGTATTIATSVCAPGSYSLSVTNPDNGCTASSIVQLSPPATPILFISSTTLVLDCNNTSQSVTVTSTPNTDVIYNWNITPLSASLDSSQATFNSPNTYICTVTNTLTNCSTPIQVIVTTNTTVPTITISGTQTLTCVNPTAVISTTTSSSVTYTWTGTVIFGQGTGSVVVNQAATFTVSVTAANGCTNTASSTVSTNTNIPVATISATSSNSVITCQNPTVTLTASVTPSATYSYTWSPSGGNLALANVTLANVYTVSLTAANGCTTTAQYTVTSNTVVPTISATNTVMACGANSVNVVSMATPANNISYSWSTSNGTIITNSLSTAVVGSVGIYTVTATDMVNGCVNTATASVTQSGISAAFSANPISGTAPLGVNFTNQSTGATSYAWTFGDLTNNTSVATNPNHTFNTSGTYIVTLVASNGLCSATATISIEVFENSTLIIPNVFTPNGDGINDVFKIVATGIKDLTCDIFNRWGTKLYTITSINDSWNGSNTSDGTYFFVLKATGFDSKEFTEKGFLNIFR